MVAGPRGARVIRMIPSDEELSVVERTTARQERIVKSAVNLIMVLVVTTLQISLLYISFSQHAATAQPAPHVERIFRTIQGT